MSVAVGGGPGGAFTCLTRHLVGVLAMRVLLPKPTGMWCVLCAGALEYFYGRNPKCTLDSDASRDRI